MAKDGDITALRLCLDRILPVRRDRPVSIELPQVATPGDIVNVLSSVVQATAKGQLTPGEASSFASLLDTQRRALETYEIEQRLTELESQVGRR